MLELKNICVSFAGKPVLADCALSLRPGERIALMGPSGCGKTTLLRVALSLQRPDSGTVRIGTRRLAAVFQEPRLLPWRTAAENVNLVLSDAPGSLSEAESWLDRLELADSHGVYPAALSGGMQQRVSLARALAAQPELLVLDEPFKAMDEALKARVMESVSHALPAAALLLVTHSESEAEALSCRILRYQQGRFA